MTNFSFLLLIILFLLIFLILTIYNPKLDLSVGEYGYRLYLWYTNTKGERAYKILLTIRP